MTKRIPVRNKLAEQLNEFSKPGETRGNAIERLAEQAGVSLSDEGVSEEVDEEAEQLAGEVMNAEDTLASKGSNYEYLKQEYDVDAAKFDDVEQLRAAVRGSGDA